MTVGPKIPGAVIPPRVFTQPRSFATEPSVQRMPIVRYASQYQTSLDAPGTPANVLKAVSFVAPKKSALRADNAPV